MASAANMRVVPAAMVTSGGAPVAMPDADVFAALLGGPESKTGDTGDGGTPSGPAVEPEDTGEENPLAGLLAIGTPVLAALPADVPAGHVMRTDGFDARPAATRTEEHVSGAADSESSQPVAATMRTGTISPQPAVEKPVDAPSIPSAAAPETPMKIENGQRARQPVADQLAKVAPASPDKQVADRDQQAKVVAIAKLINTPPVEAPAASSGKVVLASETAVVMAAAVAPRNGKAPVAAAPKADSSAPPASSELVPNAGMTETVRLANPARAPAASRILIEAALPDAESQKTKPAGDIAGSAARPMDSAPLWLSALPNAAPAGPLAAAAAAPVPNMTSHLDLSSDGMWIDQLARDIAGVSGAEGPMKFRLSPEQLGRLQVEIRQSDEGASVRLTADTEAAHAILVEAQPKLLAEARAQGLRLADAQVDLASQHNGQQQGRGREQAQPVIRTARTVQPETSSGAGRTERYA